MTLRLRPEAEADIEAIALYITEDSPAAALRWYDEIHGQCQRIADMPGMGVLLDPKCERACAPSPQEITWSSIARSRTARRSCALSMAHGSGKNCFSQPIRTFDALARLGRVRRKSFVKIDHSNENNSLERSVRE
jgi:plasmid stabilization system protein ParE